jgi:hypothetical protein
MARQWLTKTPSSGPVISRRSLLQWAGLGLGAAVTGCSFESSDAEAAASELATSQDWSALASRIRGRLILPGQADYDVARLSYNPLYDYRMPAAVAKVATPADVQQCIEFARNEGLRIAARSGGHSYAGYSTPDKGLIVDLAPMNTIRVNGDGTADIGAGARLADVYATLGAAGVCVPGGSCPTVGISGLTLGGGIGVLARLHGLTCDSLLAAEIVLPDGTVKTVSAENDPDLYWGLRGGGGGNFGIVTSFKFRTYPAPDIIVFMLKFPAGSVPNVLAAWQSWVRNAPKELWSNCIVSAGNPPICRVGGSFVGSQGDLDGLLNNLKAAARETPTNAYAIPKSYLDAMRYFAGCSQKTTEQCHLATPGGPGQLGREGFVASSRIVSSPIGDPSRVANLLSRYSGLDLLFDSLGGAVSELAPDATAFPHRNAVASIQIYKGCDAGSRSSAVRTVGEIQNGLTGIVGSGSYINYIDPNQADWATASYGGNLPRLQGLAAKYDPDSVFGNTQGVGIKTSVATCRNGGTTPGFSGINAKFQELGGCASFLGAPTSEEGNCPDGRGGFRHFERGSIYWSPQTDAHEVHGAIHAKWASLGWERSRLGYPKTDEYDIAGGRRSDFEHGSISWDATSGAVTVS